MRKYHVLFIFVTALAYYASGQKGNRNIGTETNIESWTVDSISSINHKQANDSINRLDTLSNEKCEWIGEFTTLAFFDNHDFQLRYFRDFPDFKFKYMVNPNVDRKVWDSLGERVIIGIICIYTNNRWKVFQDYFIEIDSVLSINADGKGNPEIFIYSSPNWDTYFPSDGSGWTESQTNLKVINFDSNYVILNITSNYQHRKWSNDERLDNFELKCSCNLKFELGSLIVCDYLSKFEGNENEIDSEERIPPCTPNGNYVLKDNFYIRK
jgi:hypothetical protein